MTFPIKKNSSPFPVFELFSNALNSQMGGGLEKSDARIEYENQKKSVLFDFEPKPIQEPFYLICYYFFCSYF